jgi:hypothetical protein
MHAHALSHLRSPSVSLALSPSALFYILCVYRSLAGRPSVARSLALSVVARGTDEKPTLRRSFAF